MINKQIKAVAFDAYGTLLDVYSVRVLAEELFPGKGNALSEVWRDKQIEYTRLRTMCDQYINFWEVTKDALTYAGRFLKLDLSQADHQRLMQQYERLTSFPENVSVLKQLREMDLPRAILSNGNEKMIADVVDNAGLSSLVNYQLSANTKKKFKTHPDTYQLGPDAFGLPASEILFVSSNCWDICGATWFGYTTFWVNRAGNPMEELGVKPTSEGSKLYDIINFIASQNKCKI